MPDSRLGYYLKTGTVLGCTFLLLALFCINFIDKPLALWVYRHGFLSRLFWLNYITDDSPKYLILVYIILLLVIPLATKLGNKFFLSIYVCTISTIADWIKTTLKIICGRDWPLADQEPGKYGSLIGSGDFAFHFFKTDYWQGTFPSGHTTFISVTSVTMFLILQRFKFLWVMFIVGMTIGIVLVDEHFLGDCFGGIAVGTVSAYYGFAGYLWLIQRLRSGLLGVS